MLVQKKTTQTFERNISNRTFKILSNSYFFTFNYICKIKNNNYSAFGPVFTFSIFDHIKRENCEVEAFFRNV